MAEKKRGAFKGPIRIPSSSPVFFFNDLEFFRISAKSLKFQSLLFSIPTASTNQPFFLEQLSNLSKRQKAANKSLK